MKVEVEIEDLETIIYATAIIKTIEQQLQSRKQDPFVREHLNYTAAHDALVTAMNHARRGTADTQTQWDGALTKKEIDYLTLLEKYKKDTVLPPNPPNPDFDDSVAIWELVDELMAKGCVQKGQAVAGTVWPGDTQADVTASACFHVRLTKRGVEKLAQAKHASKS
jgi:hypothetical protein